MSKRLPTSLGRCVIIIFIIMMVRPLPGKAVSVLAGQVTTPVTATDSIVKDSLQTTPRVAPLRTVTPVQNNDDRTEKPALHYFDRHGNALDEPVAIWIDEDTVKVSRAPKAPIYNGVIVGLNFFDAIMQIAGQSYGNYNISGAVDLHNWVFPTLELGVGIADHKEKRKNYHYKTKGALFTRLGVDYNFLYNSNSAYRALFGVRCGFSSFNYEITDVTISNDYWSIGSNQVTLPLQKSTAFWGEVAAGLQVRIWKSISMGWALRYKFLFSATKGSNSSPWFIPGFGARNAPFTATFSIYYTFGQRKSAISPVD